MRKESGFTIVEQAVVLVPEFKNVVRQNDVKTHKNLESVKELYSNEITSKAVKRSLSA